MKRLTYSAVIITCLAGMCNPVNANVLTFDDVSTTDYHEPIPDGYGGFNWNNFNVIYGPTFPTTAYDWGRVSGDYTAFNGYGDPAGITLSLGTFDFNGVYLSNKDVASSVQVVGYLGGATVYDTTVNLPAVPAATWFQFDYTAIDQLKFIPNGIFVMDNFTFNETVVPLPGAVILAGLGVGLVGWLKRRRTL